MMIFEEALSRLQSSCARKEMCRQDVERWMKKFKVDANDREKIIDSLLTDKYIDELRYAKAFANDSLKYNKWGKEKIAYLLHSKNIPSEYIRQAIDELDNEIYEEIRAGLVASKEKTLQPDDPQKEQKVKAYLYSKGFV